MHKFAIGLMVLGGILILIGIWIVTTAMASSDWPVVEGRILDAQVKSRFSQTSSTTNRRLEYYVEVRYGYQVDGKTYRAKRYSLGTGHTVKAGFKNSAEAREWVATSPYRVGENVAVHVDPDDPENTVIHAGILWSTWVPVMLGVLFMLLGLLSQRYIFDVHQAQES